MPDEQDLDEGWRENEPVPIDLAKIEQVVQEALARWEDLDACDGPPKRRNAKPHLRLASRRISGSS